MHYLDYAATTPVHPEVIETIKTSLEDDFANPSATYRLGQDNRRKIEAARKLIAESIGTTDVNSIIFTSGATEAINTALIQSAKALADKGKHLITSQVEHPAVYNTMKFLEDEGFEVTYLPVNRQGSVSLEDLKEAISDETILVSIMYTNNEVGAINPIAEIGQLLSEKEIFFHCDVVQAYLSEPIDVEELKIDSLAVSFHKFYGPKGSGFLYFRHHDFLGSFLHGGGQERKHRAGTENTSSILGGAKAVELAKANADQVKTHNQGLKTYLLASLAQEEIAYEINGPSIEEGANHILSLWLPGVKSSSLLIKMDLAGIQISAGSACSAGSLEPSRILTAMFGVDDPRIAETIRVSFGIFAEKEDIDALVKVIKNAK